MNNDWGQFVIDTVKFQIPVHYDQQGHLQIQKVKKKSKEYDWTIYCERRVDRGKTRVILTPYFYCLASGYGLNRREHIRLHAEVSAESAKKRVFMEDMTDSRCQVIKDKERFFKKSYPEGTVMNVSFKVLSREDNDSLHLNSQIKMYDDGKDKGGVTLRIHVVKELRENDIGPKPAKRRRVMALEGVDGNMAIAGDPIEMRTYSSVLRSRSLYFASMLDNDMKEAREMVVDIYADNVEDVEAVVFYLFTNRFKARDWTYTATKLIRLAHLYQLKGLFDLCVENILYNVNVDNYVESVKVFERYEIPEIDELIDFGREILRDLKETDSYQELSYLFRRAVLEKDNSLSAQDDDEETSDDDEP